MNSNKLKKSNIIGIIVLVIIVCLVIYLIYSYVKKDNVEGFAVPTTLPTTNPYRYYRWTITDNNYLLQNGYKSTTTGKESPDNVIEVSKFVFFDKNYTPISSSNFIISAPNSYSPTDKPINNLVNYTDNSSWLDYNAPKGSYITNFSISPSKETIRNGGDVLFDFGINYTTKPIPYYYNWKTSSNSYLRDPVSWSIRGFNNIDISTTDSLVNVNNNTVNQIPRNSYYNNFYNSLYPSLTGVPTEIPTPTTPGTNTSTTSTTPGSTSTSSTTSTTPGTNTSTTSTTPGTNTSTTSTTPGTNTSTTSTTPGTTSTTSTTPDSTSTTSTTPGSTSTTSTTPGSTSTSRTTPGTTSTTSTTPGTTSTTSTTPGTTSTTSTTPGSTSTSTTTPGTTPTSSTTPGTTPTNTNLPRNTTTPTPTNTNAPSSTTITIVPPSLHSTITPGMGNFSIDRNGANGFNVSQKGGSGTNNYFTPNIYIKRKKGGNGSDSGVDTKRIEFGLGEELQPFLYNLGRQGMGMDTASQLIYDNTGYNIGSYSGARRDPLDTGARNANISAEYEREQSATCIDCAVTDDGMEYTGNVDYFDNTNKNSSNTDYSRARDNTDASNVSGTVDSKGNFIHSCKMKKFHPGYQLQPPSCWDVPQKRPPVCLSDKKCMPAAVFDSGLSLNALQFDTAVGSIMPGFTYVEHPRS